MFTGIIEATGTIQSLAPVGGDVRISVATGQLDMGDVALGDSIAVNGVCLTAIKFSDSHFEADVSNETLACTSLGSLNSGSLVNLEKALLPTTRLGGHLVSGHVDGIGKVESLEEDGRSIRIRIRAPQELTRYIAAKGSICIDGISLTVNSIEGAVFSLNIVPHTMLETNLSQAGTGMVVNLEVDVIARYLERLLTGGDSGGAAEEEGITRTLLANAGFSTKA